MKTKSKGKSSDILSSSVPTTYWSSCAQILHTRLCYPSFLNISHLHCQASLSFLAAAFVPFPSPSLSISISPCLSASYESVRALTGLAAGCSAKCSGGLWGWTLNNCQSSLSFIQQVARRKERNYCRNWDISWCLHLYLNGDVLPLVNTRSTAGDGFQLLGVD